MEKMRIVVRGLVDGKRSVPLADFPVEILPGNGWNNFDWLVNAILQARVWLCGKEIAIVDNVTVFVGEEPAKLALGCLSGLPVAEFIPDLPSQGTGWHKRYFTQKLEVNLHNFFNDTENIRVAALKVLARLELDGEEPLLATQITKGLTEAFDVVGKDGSNKPMSPMIDLWVRRGYLVRVHGNTFSVSEQYH